MTVSAIEHKLTEKQAKESKFTERKWSTNFFTIAASYVKLELSAWEWTTNCKFETWPTFNSTYFTSIDFDIDKWTNCSFQID